MDSNAVPIDSHEVRKLRESLRDGAVRKNEDEIQVYEAAVKVCSTLLSLLEERENHSLRVKHILSNTSPSELSKSPEEDKERRVRFFVAGVERSWVEKVKIYRKRLDKEYAELRRTERLVNSETN